jgi:hypothetical protein
MAALRGKRQSPGIAFPGSDHPGSAIPGLKSGLPSELRLLFHFHHRPALVMATIGANGVRLRGRAALGAGLQLTSLQMVVRTTDAGTVIRVFAFGDGHG